MKYLALGDSITADRGGVVTYVNTLATRIGMRLFPLTSVVNNAAGGYTTVSLLTNWAEKVTGINPQVVTVMLGTNDHWLDSGGVPRVSLANYGTNLAMIVAQLQAINHGAAFNGGLPSVVVMAAPYVTTGVSSSNARLQTYVEAARSVAATAGCAFIDVNAITRALCLGSDATWNSTYTVLMDGCHLNTKGHASLQPFVQGAIVSAAFGLTSAPFADMTA